MGLRFNICELESSHKLNSEVKDLKERIECAISPELLYSSLHWMEYLKKSSIDGDTLESDAEYDVDVNKVVNS